MKKTICTCWLFICKYWFQMLSFFIVFVMGIPLCINWLYKQPAILPLMDVEWEAVDALGFYGTLLGSAATILGVYLSIQHAQKNYREDARNRIRPYMALTHIHSKYKYDFLDMLSSNNHPTQTKAKNYYEEYRLRNIFIILDKDDIKYKGELTDSQKAVIAQGGGRWEGTDKLRQFVRSDYISVPFDADNVGSGAATNLKLCFNKLDSNKKMGLDLYTIKPKDSIYVHIFSEADYDEIFGEYMLEFYYSDIEGTRYSQKYPVEIKRESDRNGLEIDLAGAQEIVQEEHQNDQI